MITHKSGTFYYNNSLAFHLPDNMALFSGEITEDCIHLIAPDDSFRFTIEIFPAAEKGAQKFIEEIYEEVDTYKMLSMRSIKTKNGLYGFGSEYEGSRHTYEEIAIETQAGDKRVLFNLWTFYRIGLHIDEDLRRRALQQVLDSLSIVQNL